MTDYLSSLNPAQKEAVTTTEGFVRVIAGAGTGKTKALSARFTYLVNDLGILPGNILCVTFTNKAANEMRQRIHNLTGDNDPGIIATFHGFCVSVLQEDAHAVSYPKSFLVLDNSDIDAMLKMVYEERNLTLRDMTFSDARDMIEIQKLFKKPEYYHDLITMSLDTLHDKYLAATDVKEIIFYGYLYQEKKCFALDYNDLIKFTLYIFSQNEEIRLKWQKKLEYIMIDEFQDIDGLQYELMEVLCAYHKNLFIVGDPDQTIYTWRGANVRYLLEFDQQFPETKTILMTENYRSTPEIISVVNSLIRNNRQRIDKDLIPTLPSGKKTVCHYADTAEGEAGWICSEIAALHEHGVPYKDITLLYRAHYVTRTMEEQLQKHEIPYTIYSGVQFFSRTEIKDALSYLRMVVYKDDLSFARIANVPKRNLGERRMNYLREYTAAHGGTLYDALKCSLEDELFKGTKAAAFVKLIERFSDTYAGRQISELLSDLLDKSGYETMLRTEGSRERLDNLAELKQSVHEYETTCGEEAAVEHYLSHVAMMTNSDAIDSGDKIKLMTVHAAKGLEFPFVFLFEMNEGIFPSKRTATLETMEEERRLAFVAMTRARKRLYLSEANGRNFDGSPRYPSRFLLDIQPEFLEYTHELDELLIADARNYIDRTSEIMPETGPKAEYAIGQRVVHAIMGPGTVVDLLPEKNAYLIRFDAIPTPRTISYRVALKEEQT